MQRQRATSWRKTAAQRHRGRSSSHFILLFFAVSVIGGAPRTGQEQVVHQQTLPQELRRTVPGSGLPTQEGWRILGQPQAVSRSALQHEDNNFAKTFWQWLWPFGSGTDSRRPGYRWDEFLYRRHDYFWEAASEEAARAALGRGESQQAADVAEAGLLPLQLRPAAASGRPQGRGQRLGQGEALAALRRMARDRAVRAGAFAGEQSPWANFNDSELVPLIPNEVMWLVAEAEDALRNSTLLDLQLALDLARLQSVAYCHFPNVAAWNCTRCRGRNAFFQVERTVYDEGWDLFGYAGWSPRLQAMVVSFRGTDSHSIYNWAENMRYWRTDFKVPFPGADGSKVHTGFYVSYNDSSLQPNITAAVRAMLGRHPGAPLYAVGHSMGAALATICAMDLKFRLGLPDVRLYTFGSPRVGNDVFAAFVANQTTASYRFTHNRDIVPSWPPTWVGFHHLPREVWQVDFGDAGVLGVCDDSGEDARCHNSVCYLGLCTSVSDHLLYLGQHMYNGIPAC